jgi:hypothetical protein
MLQNQILDSVRHRFTNCPAPAASIGLSVP